jgi:hypothetical protein
MPPLSFSVQLFAVLAVPLAKPRDTPPLVFSLTSQSLKSTDPAKMPQPPAFSDWKPVALTCPPQEILCEPLFNADPPFSETDVVLLGAFSPHCPLSSNWKFWNSCNPGAFTTTPFCEQLVIVQFAKTLVPPAATVSPFTPYSITACSNVSEPESNSTPYQSPGAAFVLADVKYTGL